jgi:CheY-like chemotaxis protein
MAGFNDPTPVRSSEQGTSPSPDDLVTLLSQKVVGQPAAMKVIVPYVHMYQAGFVQEGRPAGVFLLLGPTGTGKTRTVEAIAEVLHGSAKRLLKVDCGEFQMDHEVAKLIGSPPGYLGHRETPPMLSQDQLNAMTSPQCGLSLVLFDEIEKAAPTMTRLLLGILDKATLRLGDNTTVDFQNSLIFFTSNLGAHEMMKELTPGIGFQTAVPKDRSIVSTRLESIALAAVRKRFSPEFINRIDAIVTYQPLDQEALGTILDQHIHELERYVSTRLGARCFVLDVTEEGRQFLLRVGTSEEYGARELKRTLHRHLTQPLATMVASGQVEPGARVRVSLSEDEQRLLVEPLKVAATVSLRQPTILIVDDNRDLLLFLERLLEEVGWNLLTADSAVEARRLFTAHKPDAVLLDYLLGDEDGVKLGLEFQTIFPQTQFIIMTGGIMSLEEEIVCEERDIPILWKPFLASDVLDQIRARLIRHAAASSEASRR